MPDLIYKDQSGFTKGRQAPDATRRMINVIHHAEISGTPSLLLSLNAGKAFDRVHWSYLRMVLQKFGLRGNILKAIMALYTTPLAQVFSVDAIPTIPHNKWNMTRLPIIPAHFQSTYGTLGRTHSIESLNLVPNNRQNFPQDKSICRQRNFNSYKLGFFPGSGTKYTKWVQ